MDAPELLDGWKEIATYLGRSVRSAQRWESQLALPVHRIPTPDGGQLVYARRAEIDAWREREGDVNGAEPPGGPETVSRNGHGRLRPDEVATSGLAPPVNVTPHPADSSPPATRQASAPPRSRRWLVTVALLTIANLGAAAVLGRTWWDARAGIASYEIAGESVRALTQGGRTVWVFDRGRAVAIPATLRGGRPARPVDLDRDGRPDVVVAIRETSEGQGGGSADVLYAFGHDGALRWRVEPRLVLRDETRTFAGPWVLRAVYVDESADEVVIYAAFTHASWRPSFVLRLTADGRATVMYLQEGWVYALAVWTTGAQRYLAAGGNVSHHDRPSVALIPIGGAGARLELDPANPLRCDGCPDAQPARLTLLPNSDVTRALYRPFGWVWMLRVVDGRLRVSVDAGFGEGSIALLDTGGHVSDYRFAARYWEAHRQLFDEQRLDHNVDACPHLYEVHTIDEWTAATGRWERYTVRPAAGAADEVRPTSD